MSMRQRSGTLFTASPPWMRPRLIEGLAESGVDSSANGRRSIARKGAPGGVAPPAPGAPPRRPRPPPGPPPPPDGGAARSQPPRHEVHGAVETGAPGGVIGDETLCELELVRRHRRRIPGNLFAGVE